MDCLAWMARWIIVGGAVCLAFSPFFVAPKPLTLFPALFIRVIVVRTVIELMALAYLVLCLFCKGVGGYRPRHSWIAWAVGALLGAFLLATLCGVNPYRSFWGSHERMEGYVTLLHFGVLFLVLYGTLHTPEAYKPLLWASVLLSVGECGYAFRQLPERLTGTFNNADFLALYLLFQIFFAMLLVVWEGPDGPAPTQSRQGPDGPAPTQSRQPQRWRRAVLVGVGLINVVALFCTGTRGAMLGLYAGVGLLSLGYILFAGHRRLRLGGLGALGLGMALLGTLYAYRHSPFVQEHELLRRATIIAVQDPAIISRWMTWKTGLAAGLERFWLGYGPENFSYAFHHYYNPALALYEPGDFDRSHNRFVDAFVTGGVVGLVTHLAVFATAGGFLLRQWWRQRSSMVPLVGLALLVAYFVHLCTLFDHILSYQCFALFLALLATWEVQAARGAPPPPCTGRVPMPDCARAGMPYKIGVVVLAVLGMLRFMWDANIAPAQASHLAYVAAQINTLSHGRDFHQAFAALQRALALHTYLDVNLRMLPWRLELSEFASTQDQTAPPQAQQHFSRPTLEYLADQLSHSLHDHHPDVKDYLSHIMYGHLAEWLAAYDPAWREKALASYQQGLQEYPHKWELVYGLTCAYLRQRRLEDALQVYAAHPLEVADGVLFFNYAVTLYVMGRSEEAWQHMERAMAFGYDFTRILPQLVAVLEREKHYDRIARLYEHQLRSYQQDNPHLLGALTYSYWVMGDAQNAQRVGAQLRAVASQARQDPRAFLKSLAAPGPSAPVLAPQCQ